MGISDQTIYMLLSSPDISHNFEYPEVQVILVGACQVSPLSVLFLYKISDLSIE